MPASFSRAKHLLPAGLMSLAASLALPYAALAQNAAQNAANNAANNAAGSLSGDTASTLNSAIRAGNGGTSSQIKLQTTFGFQTLGQAINTIISIIFIVAGLLAFFYILLGAFNYLTAGDDTAKTGKARTMITNAVIGLILVALVYVIWVIAIHLVPGLDSFFAASS